MALVVALVVVLAVALVVALVANLAVTPALESVVPFVAFSFPLTPLVVLRTPLSLQVKAMINIFLKRLFVAVF